MHEFFEFYMNRPQTSAWINFPEHYKIIGTETYLDFKLKSINRATYSILDFLGDIGGFVDILYIMGIISLSKITQFFLDVNILH